MGNPDTTLVVNTSFKTRDQYGVLEHINGALAIQIASFIMLAIPMYTYYERPEGEQSLNWNTCAQVHEWYLAPDNSTCKDDTYEYGVAYPEELLAKKDKAFRDCIKLVEGNDDCTLYFMAVRVMVINVVCIIGCAFTSKFSTLEREHKQELDDAKLTSRKAELDKSSGHNIIQAWSTILPTMVYLLQMFELIVRFSSVSNYYTFVKVQKQEVTDQGLSPEPAYKLRPFVTILMFITIDYVSQFTSLFVLGFMNLFSACKPSFTDRLTDPDWRFKVKLYTVILNVMLNNIVIVRLVEFEPQMTNFVFMRYLYHFDLIFVAIFLFGSSLMLWIKLFFGKIFRFDAEGDHFSLQWLSNIILPFVKIRFFAIFVSCIYVVIFYRRGQGELHASRQMAYDWIEFQTLMIFGLCIYALTLQDLTTAMPKAQIPTLSSKETVKVEEVDSEEEAKEEENLQYLLSSCLKSSFEEFLKVKLLLKEIDHLKEEIKNNANNQRLVFGLNIKLKTLETQYKESKGNAILGKLKEDEEQKEFEKFIIGKVNPDRGEEKNKVLEQIGDYLKQWYNKELQQINYASRKQKFIDLIAEQIKEDCSSQHKAYRDDLRGRFAVFDEVYAEALLDSVIQSVFALGNDNKNITKLFEAIQALKKYDSEDTKEQEEEEKQEEKKVDAADMEEQKASAEEEKAQKDKAKKAKKGGGFGLGLLRSAVTTKSRATLEDEIAVILKDLAKNLVFDQRSKLAEKIESNDDSTPEEKNIWLRVQPFIFNKNKTLRATIRVDASKGIATEKQKFAYELFDTNALKIKFDFNTSWNQTKADNKNAIKQYCVFLNQFAADPEKARDADFDCSGEGGAQHVMGAYYIEEGEEQENKVLNAEDKPVNIDDLKFCDECFMPIVWPRKSNVEGEDWAMPKPGILAYYCRGFKCEGRCNMVYCIGCSRDKIAATSAFTDHDEEDKYLALGQDIYSACFLSFITDSSQIPPQPLQDPMQQSGLFQKVQMTFAIQSGICFLILQSSFDNEFQKPEPLFLMMQMLTAYLFHASAMNDVKGGYIKLKYLYRNMSKFEDTSVFSAFIVCFQQFSIALVCETMNLIFLCKQKTFVDLVLNYVAFAGILMIDDEILASISLNFPGLVAILEDPSLLKQLKIVKDKNDLSQADGEDRETGRYVSPIFHLMRIIYKLFYFYLFPLMVIPLQIYLFKKFVDTSNEGDGFAKFFGSIVPVDSVAVEATVAEQMYNKDGFETYALRVLAVFYALLPLGLTAAPFTICLEIYKDHKRKEAEQKLKDENSLEDPLLGDGADAINQSVDQSVLVQQREEAKKNKNVCVDVCFGILGLVLLVLYPFYIKYTADFFAYCLQFQYGTSLVVTCVFVVCQFFFFPIEFVIISGPFQLFFLPLVVGNIYWKFDKISWFFSNWAGPLCLSIFTSFMCLASPIPDGPKCCVFLVMMAAGPFIYKWFGMKALYYVICVPIYWVGYFFVYLIPYYLIYVPIYYIGVGFVMLKDWLATFGLLRSVVTTGGSTAFKIVSAPLYEFVYKPLGFIFGEDKAEYVILLMLVPFVLVLLAAIVSGIKKCCTRGDKQKKD